MADNQAEPVRRDAFPESLTGTEKKTRSMLPNIWAWVESLPIDGRLSAKFAIVIFSIFLIYMVSVWAFGLVAFKDSWSEFANEIYKSFGSNIVFFLLIGLGSVFLGLIQPKKEPIERRVDYLITSEVTSTARDFIKSELQKLCAYNEKVDLIVTILAIEEKDEFYLAQFDAGMIVRNVMKRDKYEYPEYKTIVKPGLVRFGDNRDVAEVILAEISYGPGDKIQMWTKERTWKDVVEKSDSARLEISGDGRAEVRQCFRVWCDNITPCEYKLYRYADLFTVTVFNRTSKKLGIVTAGGQHLELEPGQQKAIYSSSAETGQRNLFSLKF